MADLEVGQACGITQLPRAFLQTEVETAGFEDVISTQEMGLWLPMGTLRNAAPQIPMRTLYLMRPHGTACLDGEELVVRSGEEELDRMALPLLDQILVFGTMQLTKIGRAHV